MVTILVIIIMTMIVLIMMMMMVVMTGADDVDVVVDDNVDDDDDYEDDNDNGDIDRLTMKMMMMMMMMIMMSSLFQDEATASLMIYARSFIRKLGSSFINQLGWRDMWAFVAQRINNEKFVYAEGFQHSAIEHDWAPPVTIHTTVPLRPESVVKCSWEDNEENHRRREFCDTFDGYTGICNCK